MVAWGAKGTPWRGTSKVARGGRTRVVAKAVCISYTRTGSPLLGCSDLVDSPGSWPVHGRRSGDTALYRHELSSLLVPDTLERHLPDEDQVMLALRDWIAGVGAVRAVVVLGVA